MAALKVRIGKPSIRGLRISVEHVLKALAGGVTTDELLKECPGLEPEDIIACFPYVADLDRGRLRIR